MNIHCQLDQDDPSLHAFEEAALAHPVDRKVDGERILYRTPAMMMPEKLGRPILCDFGEAVFGQPDFIGLLQPTAFRSPEMVLDMP